MTSILIHPFIEVGKNMPIGWHRISQTCSIKRRNVSRLYTNIINMFCSRTSFAGTRHRAPVELSNPGSHTTSLENTGVQADTESVQHAYERWKSHQTEPSEFTRLVRLHDLITTQKVERPSSNLCLRTGRRNIMAFQRNTQRSRSKSTASMPRKSNTSLTPVPAPCKNLNNSTPRVWQPSQSLSASTQSFHTSNGEHGGLFCPNLSRRAIRRTRRCS